MGFVLTVVAAREKQALTDAIVARVRDAVGACGAIAWLSAAEAADIEDVREDALEPARLALAGEAADVFLTRAASRRCALLVSDMDSTIVTSETLDDLAARAGVGDAVAAITARSMNGEVDFREALRARAAMLRGLDLAALEETWREVRLMPGARTLVATMRAHGARAVLISGGFSFFTARVAALCGFDSHFANVLLDNGAALTGEVQEPILGQDTKREVLQRQAASNGVRQEETLALGDGANDLAMLREAGLGIAYHAKPIVARAIQNRIDHGTLRAVLFAQGYKANQFQPREE